MLKKSLWFLPPTLFGIIILFTSIFRVSSIKYQFEPSPFPVVGKQTSFVLPGSPLWPLVVAGEKIDTTLTFNSVSKTAKIVAIADKRLMLSSELFHMGKSEEGYSVLTKAEKYLEQAAISEEILRKSGADTNDVLQKLSISAEKHIAAIEDMQEVCPETAKPLVNLTANYPKRLQLEIQSVLYSLSSDVSAF